MYLWHILWGRSWDGRQVIRVVGEVNNSDPVSVSLNLIMGESRGYIITHLFALLILKWGK